MKKQLLIAAVAATMTSAAMADLSISGDAKFEYQNVDTNATTNVNQTNTEVNLKLRGQSGDTSVVVDVASDGNSGLVVEDQYLTTKVGDVTVKAGNYATDTSSILGEIEEGARSHNKVTLSTTLGGMNVYMGNGGNAALGAPTTGSTGFTPVNNNTFAGVSAKVAGFTVQAKHNSETTDSFGIAGDVAGVSVRLETMNVDGANKDVTFGNITTDVNGVSLGYAWIDADANGLIKETDSSIFAVENGLSGYEGDSNSQVTAKTSMAGNTVTVKAGTIGFATAADLDYTQVGVTRPLASGATLAVTYTNADVTTTTDKKTFEAELSVTF